MSEHLSRVRIRHARPANVRDPATLLSAIPLSFVSSDGCWKDAVFCPRPRLIDGHAPAFSHDWKSNDRNPIEAYFGLPSVKRELRVRTAIDPAKRRAHDEQLFAYESVDSHELRWTTAIDLDRVPEPDQARVIRELSQLLSGGLFGVGKTKAHLQATLGERNATKFPSSLAPSIKGEIVVQLQTPALLGAPGPSPNWEQARTAEAVRAIYKQVWSELSADALEFEYGFYQQAFAGGLYLHNRFRRNAKYQPWLLTGAGSVFVLRVLDPVRARDCLDLWLRVGLPISHSVAAHYKLPADPFEHWQECPWVPENGFGEIGVNLYRNWSGRILEAQ